jgi:hypothetical protein
MSGSNRAIKVAMKALTFITLQTKMFSSQISLIYIEKAKNQKNSV